MSAVTAVILAAGLSSRMRANKLLLSLRGQPIIRHTVLAALNSRAAPVVVITGSASAEIVAALRGMPVQIEENPLYTDGLSESLKCGVKNIPAESTGALIMLGDMPFVAPSTIDRLINTFGTDAGHDIVVPVCQERRGNPVLWSRRFFPEILALRGDKGAKSLMALHPVAIHELEVDDPGVLIDIDDPADLEQHQL